MEGRTRGKFKVKIEKVPFGGFPGQSGAEPANIAKKNRAERMGRWLSCQEGYQAGQEAGLGKAQISERLQLSATLPLGPGP